MDLAAALVAFVGVAVVVYVLTVVYAATMRMLVQQDGVGQPETRLLAWPKWLWALVVGLLVAWLLYRVRGILLPFVLGAVTAYVLNPGIDRLERRGWSRTRAIGVVFGMFLLLFVGGGLLLVPVLASEARNLTGDYPRYVEQGQRLAVQVKELVTRWGGPAGVVPEDVRSWLGQLGDDAQRYGLALLNAGLLWLKGAVGIISLLVITPAVTFWFLRDYHMLSRRLLRALPEKQRESVVGILKDINRLAGSYLLGLLTMVCVVGIYAIIVLSIAGVRFAVLLGIMLGVLSSIPYVGFPSAVAIIVLAMLVTGMGMWTIVIVLAALIAGNIISDYVVAPRVLGRRVGLHPLVVIFAILAGATLFKFIGMVLAVPVAGVVKVVLMHFWPEIFSAEPAEAASP